MHFRNKIEEFTYNNAKLYLDKVNINVHKGFHVYL